MKQPGLVPCDLCEKDDFPRAGSLERASIPVSEHVTDHQSGTGDQGLYVLS